MDGKNDGVCVMGSGDVSSGLFTVTTPPSDIDVLVLVYFCCYCDYLSGKDVNGNVRYLLSSFSSCFV